MGNIKRPRVASVTVNLLSPFSPPVFMFVVCSVRVIGESDIMQEFLSESDEVNLFPVPILTIHMHVFTPTCDAAVTPWSP